VQVPNQAKVEQAKQILSTCPPFSRRTSGTALRSIDRKPEQLWSEIKIVKKGCEKAKTKRQEQAGCQKKQGKRRDKDLRTELNEKFQRAVRRDKK